MNKKAQFYLIAALIISAIILSFGRSYTSSKIEETPVEVYDLSDQLQYEASQVIDNGLLQERSISDIEEDLRNLTAYYATLNPDSDIDIIYGNESALNVISYSTESKDITIDPIPLDLVTFESESLSALSTTRTNLQQDTIESTAGTETEISRDLKKIRIRLIMNKNTEKERTVENSFDIKSGQNLYIIVRKKVKDQDVVIYR